MTSEIHWQSINIESTMTFLQLQGFIRIWIPALGFRGVIDGRDCKLVVCGSFSPNMSYVDPAQCFSVWEYHVKNSNFSC